MDTIPQLVWEVNEVQQSIWEAQTEARREADAPERLGLAKSDIIRVAHVASRFRSRICAAMCLSVITASGPAQADWMGHLANLSDAQNACRDIDSNACEPFLAEAVAIADLLHEQSKVAKVGGEDKAFLPGGLMSVWACDLSVHDRLNGQSLLHLALALSAPDSESLYWTQALRAAALQQCKPTK